MLPSDTVSEIVLRQDVVLPFRIDLLIWRIETYLTCLIRRAETEKMQT
jgi:hypothetical protein